MALSILLNGARGRMGEAVALASKDLGLSIGAAADADDDIASALPACDVIIDFSFHRATQALLELAIAQSKPIVIGTMSAATAAAQPPDEPPAMRARSCGLRVTP